MASAMTPRSFASLVCQSCRLRLKPITTSKRAFSTTPARPADALSALSNVSHVNSRRQDQRSIGNDDNLADLLDSLNSPSASRYLNENAGRNLDAQVDVKSHRLHVLATKHNTHLTLVQPPRPASQTASSGISSTNASAADQKKMVDVLLSISAGNIGFKKAGRGTYDAAYQLTAFTLKTMKEKGMLRDIEKLEIVMRGFGPGREAVTKALLGAEGQIIRDKISAVVDATRLKIGGTRSPRPRRLG
ncbi:hypothetical protein Q7P37_001040 [Cladosporium fusiforme]